MSIVRLFVGGSVILLSLAGLVLCCGGVAGVWTIGKRVEALGNVVFSTVDESLIFVDAKVQRVQQAVNKCRTCVRGLSLAAQRLAEKNADLPKESEPLRQGLGEIFQQLNDAQSWLESGRAAAQGVSRISAAVVSSEYAAAHEESAGVALAQRVRELSDALAAALRAVQVWRNELIELRDSGRLARQIAASTVARVADLNGKLGNVSVRLEKFQAQVQGTKASIAGLQRRIHRWLAVAAVGLSAVCLWLGISQISMLGHGRRIMRARTR